MSVLVIGALLPDNWAIPQPGPSATTTSQAAPDRGPSWSLVLDELTSAWSLVGRELPPFERLSATEWATRVTLNDLDPPVRLDLTAVVEQGTQTIVEMRITQASLDLRPEAEDLQFDALVAAIVAIEGITDASEVSAFLVTMNESGENAPGGYVISHSTSAATYQLAVGIESGFWLLITP